MNFLDNLVIALCFTFNLCDQEQHFFIRPSVSLMPEEVFTNLANYERVKGKNSYKVFSKWMVLNHRGVNATRPGKMQVRLPLPDLGMKVKKIPGYVHFNFNPARHTVSLCYLKTEHR